MKMISQATLLAVVIAGLNACAVTQTQTTPIGSRWGTTADKLANGNIVKISMLKPTAAWACRQLDEQSFKWSSLQYQGQFMKIDDAYDMLRKKVVKYANDQHMNTNYICFTVPTTSSSNNFNLRSTADKNDINVKYYLCKKLEV